MRLESERPWIEPFVQTLGRPAFQLAMALTRDASLAEELTQEAFVRVWQSPRAPRELVAFRAFLYKTLLNLVRDLHRRRSRWARLRWWPAVPADPAREAERLLGDAEVASALQSLSPREREAVYLRYFEDASYEQMSRIMGASESTARVLVHRALAKLRPRLEAAGFAPERSNA
jgi:RNA polymerase sigma factor (sigma-70 family)